MTAIRKLDVGEVFADRYRIDRRVDEGGMGVVYAAHDTRLAERVALKTLSIGSDPDRIQRFQREVRLARRITHANVARTHDIGEHDGVHFLTMELIDGASLDAMIDDRMVHAKPRQGPFSPTDATAMAAQIGRGLAAAHAAGVVHRDLKPANVMIEGAAPDGRVVLTDFGVARALDSDGKRTSGALGTPIYMAPEQIMGEATTPATDIYSLGVILYELLTGRLPFSGDTPMAVALARCRVPPTDPREHVELNGPLCSVLLQCLDPHPNRRPTAAGDVAELLMGYAVAASARTVMVAPSRPAASTMGSSSGSISSPFAPMSPGKRTLAVLPFKYRGPADLDYLGESLTQELIDTLSRTRGLRVLGYGATSRFADLAAPDPRVVGEELGADAIVSASVQASPSRVRVAARLTDVSSGVQIWSDKFDKGFEDVFEMQDIVSQRVADALRVELNTIAHQWRASAEASELYLRARRVIEAKQYLGAAEAVDLLDRCVELSPQFSPAVAARAIAAVKAWWSDILSSSSANWRERAKRYVDEALEQGEDLAETHLAVAMYALQVGNLARTASALSTALSIAPTLPDAHRYLADLQCEAGRLEEGRRRAKLALDLDPSQSTARMCIARAHALLGERDAYEREIATLAEEEGEHNSSLLIMRLRYAVWFDALDSIQSTIDHILTSSEPLQMMAASFVRYNLGEGDASTLDGALVFLSAFDNPRLTSLVGQMVTEAHCAVGDLDKARRTLATTADGVLADVAWLEKCPLLRPLHGTPEYADALVKVRNRANAIWEIRPVA